MGENEAPSSGGAHNRIAKNTLFLYFRMLITLVVSLYTSRVLLNTLGVDDYGIYNLVGGIIVVLAFFNSAMSSATQRFLNVELGLNNRDKLQEVFSTSLIIHFLIAIIVLLLAETVGIWFINKHLNIPEDRMIAANWVFQFSVAAFIVNIISIPYNAAIIAHEKMSAFAYISIIEVLLKLIIVFFLQVILFDKLILYAFLVLVISIIIRIIYGTYCSKKFEECHFVFKINKTLFKSLLSFSSWSLFGNLGYILHTQGISIALNIFFGTTVNAAQAVANQVNSVVKGFVLNFTQALNPQIVKNHASGESDKMHILILKGCRFSYFLIMIFAIPLILETPVILKVWLKMVPDYTVIFIRLTLLLSLVDSFTGVLTTAQGATGRIKKYQIVLTLIGIFHLPLSVLYFYLGYDAYYTMYVYLVIIIILQMTRISFVCNSIKIPKIVFLKEVILPCIYVTVLAMSIPLLIHIYLNVSVLSSIIVCVISGLTSIAFIYMIGLQKDERMLLKKQVYKMFK